MPAADGFGEYVRVRPADASVDEVGADNVVADRQPLGLPRVDLLISQSVGTVDRREGADELAKEGPDRRGGALGGVVVVRLLPSGDPLPPLREVLV